jgi:hypothetical protein
MLRVFRIVLLLCLTFSQVITAEAKIKMMRITPAKQKVILQHFNIVEAIDARTDTGSIGYLTTGAHNYFLQANFHQSLGKEFMEFMVESVSASTQATSVRLVVKDYFLHEVSTPGGANIALRTHYVIESLDGKRLKDYKQLDFRNTGMNMAAFAGELLCRSFTLFLQETDYNMPTILDHANNNKSLNTLIEAPQQIAQGAYFIYHPKKLISVSQFRAKVPESSSTAAFVDCGIEVEYLLMADSTNDYHITLEVLPYMDQSKSWIKRGPQTRDAIFFGQTQFSIANYVFRIIKRDAADMVIAFDDLEVAVTEMKVKYKQLFDKMQQEYLEDTENGKNMAAVSRWENRLRRLQ